MSWLSFGIAFLITSLSIPAIRAVSLRLGCVSLPRTDRWNKRPTALLGGLGLFLAYALAMLAVGGREGTRWELVAAPGIMLVLGLYDDFKQLTPATKLILQILAASLLIFFGYTINFTVWAAVNVLITFLWLVGITNAINLLDNMDGLAAGVSFVAAGFLSYFFWTSNDPALLLAAMALAGSLLGFLIYNFPPASIFMGDSGSLFLGFTLAALAIARIPRASNIFAVLGVPTLLLLLPIVDTLLVTTTRLLRGLSPIRGGSDHTSHRLVAFGLSERQALLVLYAIALASGITGTVLEALDYDLSLVLIPVLLLSLALLAAYLGRLTVLPIYASEPRAGIARFVVELTVKRRLLEAGLDFLLIGVAYYLALWTRSSFSLTDADIERFVRSMPVVVASVLLVSFGFGVYRGVWRYAGVEDLFRYALTSLAGALLVSGLLRLIFPSEAFSAVLFFLFAVFLFLGLTGSRFSFRVLDQLFGHQAVRTGESPVLIYGAGDSGEMALRWILRNPELGYQPVGFLDEDPFKWGRRIHGINVLGDLDELDALLERYQVDGIILALEEGPDSALAGRALAALQTKNIWVRRLRFEFELIEDNTK